jgi:hypothetical protein
LRTVWSASAAVVRYGNDAGRLLHFLTILENGVPVLAGNATSFYHAVADICVPDWLVRSEGPAFEEEVAAGLATIASSPKKTRAAVNGLLEVYGSHNTPEKFVKAVLGQ